MSNATGDEAVRAAPPAPVGADAEVGEPVTPVAAVVKGGGPGASAVSTDSPAADAELVRMVAAAEARSRSAASAPLRLMAVHAHPDDESSKGAATLAKYADEGVGVVVVSCTGGERGDVLNPNFDAEGVDIPQVRLAEMARAAEILGVAHVWLGFEDSGYHEGAPDTWSLPPGTFGDLDPDVEIEALVKVVRAFRPHVMTTYDENGGYPHPDHIRTHIVSVGAFEAAGDPDAYPDAGDPWQPLKLYYNSGSRKRIFAINDAVRERTGEGPFDEWVKYLAEHPRADRSDLVTTRVPVVGYLDARDAALRAHATQIDPQSHWFAVPRDLEEEIWGTDDYELARSLVDPPRRSSGAGASDAPDGDAAAGAERAGGDAGATVETDLFEGLRERVQR